MSNVSAKHKRLHAQDPNEKADKALSLMETNISNLGSLLVVASPYSLQHTATHCDTLQHTATQHTTIHYNTLQHTATHCNTLQHTATLRNTLQHIATEPANRCHPIVTATHCKTLHHSATHYNTLQQSLLFVATP